MLYQLFGSKDLRIGELVDMGPINERWGRIVKVQEEDYKLPNPCMVTGQTKFYPQPINLYLIRGGYKNERNEPCRSVWGFTA